MSRRIPTPPPYKPGETVVRPAPPPMPPAPGGKQTSAAVTQYYRKEDVERLLRGMHSEMSAVQRPALDRIERAVQRLEIVRLPGDEGE